MSTSEHIQALSSVDFNDSVITDDQYRSVNPQRQYWDSPMSNNVLPSNVRSISQVVGSTSRYCQEHRLIFEQSICGTHKAVTDENVQLCATGRVYDAERKSAREQAKWQRRPRKLKPVAGDQPVASEYGSYKSIKTHAAQHTVNEQSTGGIYKTVAETIAWRQSEQLLKEQSTRGTYPTIQTFQGQTSEDGAVAIGSDERSHPAKLRLVSDRTNVCPDSQRYEIIEVLSQSQTNIVYLALDRSSGREVECCGS